MHSSIFCLTLLFGAAYAEIADAGGEDLEDKPPLSPTAQEGACQNNGRFEGGQCVCLDGFSGPTCERESHCAGYKRNPDNSCYKCVPGYVGAFCDEIVCKNGERSQDQTCDCSKPYSGPFCDELRTGDVYLYYNSMIYQFGPVGALIILPMVFIKFGCSRLAKERHWRRVEKDFECTHQTDISASAVKHILNAK